MRLDEGLAQQGLPLSSSFIRSNGGQLVRTKELIFGIMDKVP